MDIEEFRNYCLSFAGAHDDFPFRKTASDYDRDILVFYVLDKWFCFVNAVARDFCNLRCPTERIAELQARYERIGPGWHMNKKHWLTVCLDGSVDSKTVLKLLQESFDLAKK